MCGREHIAERALMVGDKFAAVSRDAVQKDWVARASATGRPP